LLNVASLFAAATPSERSHGTPFDLPTCLA
jgi:hypothetical protein